MKTYPIAIFAYNRPKHLRNLLDSLENNRLSELSDVSIFIDKCDDEKIHNSILEVANKKRKFRSLSIITHDENIGLKSNLIFGINEVLNNDDGIIVLEDDLLLDEYFLEFMNKSLNEYKESGDVYHVNGWSYPQLINRKKSNFVGSLASPWGWATWKNRWDNFNDEYQSNDYINKKNQKYIKKFNYYNLTNFSRQLLANTNNEINTLDIYWYQFIFLNNGKTIFPKHSLVSNNGFDGSGMHCGVSDKYEYKMKNLKINNFTRSNKQDLINLVSTYYFYFKLKLKDYVTYHIKKIFN
tara:strand:+ start:1145 stop:2032 length:888 start_codon:yes stop_codon:yes gene_type:complete